MLAIKVSSKPVTVTFRNVLQLLLYALSKFTSGLCIPAWRFQKPQQLCFFVDDFEGSSWLKPLVLRTFSAVEWVLGALHL